MLIIVMDVMIVNKLIVRKSAIMINVAKCFHIVCELINKLKLINIYCKLNFYIQKELIY